jgi:AraC family transcriptional activator of pobA
VNFLTDNTHKEATVMPDKTFPLNVFSTRKIRPHWHEHMEWIYIKKGKVQLQIDNTIAVLQADELAFINSKQLHEAIPLDTDTELVAIVFNEVLIRNSGLDSTESRYFAPILNHSLLLPNFLKSDDPICRNIITSVSRLLEEFDDKKTGFELFIKGELYRLFGLIVRHYPELWNIQYTATPLEKTTI